MGRSHCRRGLSALQNPVQRTSASVGKRYSGVASGTLQDSLRGVLQRCHFALEPHLIVEVVVTLFERSHQQLSSVSTSCPAKAISQASEHGVLIGIEHIGYLPSLQSQRQQHNSAKLQGTQSVLQRSQPTSHSIGLPPLTV